MTAYRGVIYSFQAPHEFVVVDGYMVVRDGKIISVQKERPKTEEIVDYGDALILPGFVDTHIHLPQINARGRWSEDLLTWLERYIFPEERRFLDKDYALKNTEKFFYELKKNGTTTALVYGPPSPGATEVAMNVAKESGLRVFMGQTLMDMNVPDELKTQVNDAVAAVKDMGQRWRGGLVQYALTLRFAISCSMELMRETSKIAREMNMIIQTHISEQKREIAEVKKIHGRGYAQVYDDAGVLYPRTVLAHGIHLTDEERTLIAARGAKIAHCPSSNFFLHSGVMNMESMDAHGIAVALGSDIAAGPFINMLPVLRNVYYANLISPEKAFYLLTLGGAKVLGIDSITGSLEPGKSADFVVVEPIEKEAPRDMLSKLMFLGDDRNILATYVQGKNVYDAHQP
ncbi:MAG: guanine deaminase [Euryarchaeota archaeon]|nr:guanine deaminase [Euryarchaeota archaeon]